MGLWWLEEGTVERNARIGKGNGITECVGQSS